MLTTITNHQEITEILSATFGQRAAEYDKNGVFVEENYRELKLHRYFAALVPQELGGEGFTFEEMADTLRIIGSQCASTGLSLSMHSHLVAANVWKYKQGYDTAAALRKIADYQPVLVSTGAKDWLESNGIMEKVDGGYLVSATKHFASQSAVGNIMITSAVYQHPDNGAQVLHFPVQFSAKGVEVLHNWKTLGMRGTGSHSIKLEEVFVADEDLVMTRPQGQYHPVFNVVLTVAMPLIMSVYVGIAQRAAEIAIDAAGKVKNPPEQLLMNVAKMNNLLTTAEVNWRDMIRINNNFDFEATTEVGHQIVTRKTNVANAVIEVVSLALDIVGGSGYFKKHPMERLFRDIQGARFHPLQESEQLVFSGKHMLDV